MEKVQLEVIRVLNEISEDGGGLHDLQLENLLLPLTASVVHTEGSLAFHIRLGEEDRPVDVRI